MSITIPAEKKGESAVRAVIPPGAHQSTFTGSVPFSEGEPYFASKPLTRPIRTHPTREITTEELQLIAEQNPPPAEWFAGEDECPFVTE